MAGGGAGVLNLSLSDDALGYGSIVKNVFCGFDKKCRREANRTPDAPDNYNLTFNSTTSNNSGGIGTNTLVIIIIGVAALAAVFLLTKDSK